MMPTMRCCDLEWLESHGEEFSDEAKDRKPKVPGSARIN